MLWRASDIEDGLRGIHEEGGHQSVLVSLVDQVANADTFSQGQAVLSGEGQHVLYGPPPLVILSGSLLSGSLLVLVQGLQGADHDLFGRVVAARAQVSLDQ